MPYRRFSVVGTWETTPVQHGEPRGVFVELFQGGPASSDAAVGYVGTLRP